RESFKNVQQREKLKAVTILEFNQTRNDLNRAETDLIRAKYDYIFKLKILDFYQGKTLSF
ncbi:MAG: TolC family protein, partial [Bacteroidota bacterium]